MQDILEEILDAFSIEMYHLASNRISKIVLFIWAIKFQEFTSNIVAFYALLEMHCQFLKKII